MDKKYGAYICEGCGIGEALDIEKLCDVAKEEGFPVKTCPVLCSKAGIELLKKDIILGYRVPKHFIEPVLSGENISVVALLAKHKPVYD